jgi:aminopeptidase
MADDQGAPIERLAALAVDVSANVADGQTVIVRAHLVDASLVRAIVRAAYRRGANQVEVDWNDPLVRKIRLEEAGDAALGWVSPWLHELPTKLGE